jgi:hypothetical protein
MFLLKQKKKQGKTERKKKKNHQGKNGRKKTIWNEKKEDRAEERSRRRG